MLTSPPPPHFLASSNRSLPSPLGLLLSWREGPSTAKRENQEDAHSSPPAVVFNFGRQERVFFLSHAFFETGPLCVAVEGGAFGAEGGHRKNRQPRKPPGAPGAAGLRAGRKIESRVLTNFFLFPFLYQLSEKQARASALQSLATKDEIEAEERGCSFSLYRCKILSRKKTAKQ